MAGTKTKVISLTEKETSVGFKLGADKIINFYGVNSGADSSITYIDKTSGKVRTMTVDQTPATINTAAAKTFAVTLVTGETLYIHADRVVYIADLGSTRLISYYNEQTVLEQLSVSTSAAAINSAAGNTFSITLEDGTTRYINCNMIGTMAAKGVTAQGAVSAEPAAAGTGYVPTNTIVLDGGTNTGAAELTVDTTKLISTVANAIGADYEPGDEITTSGGAGDTDATLEVTTVQLATTAGNAPGAGYAPGNTITLAGGTSSVKAILAILTTQLISAVNNAAGTLYTAGDVLTLVGGTHSVPAQVTVDTVDGGGAITGFTITDPGSYTVNSATFTVTGGTGSGATFNAASYGVLTFSYSNRGTYTVTTPTFTQFATSGSGTGATFDSASFGVKGITVADGGSYTTNAASFTQASTTGAGSGATFNTTSYGVATVSVSDAGEYTVVPSNPAAQDTTSGSGTGATFNVTWGAMASTGSEILYDAKGVAFVPLVVDEDIADLQTTINAL